MTSTGSVIASFLTAISTLLGLAVEVGLLVIALSIVKPRRSDAAMPLVAGAAAHLFATVLWPLVSYVIVPAIGRGEDTIIVYQVTSLFLSLVRTAGWVAILYGIVKLAGAPPGSRGIPSPWS
jgi:hypothetical protein